MRFNINETSEAEGTADHVTLLQLFGSGPVGDDDLWYHHILVTLCSLCLSVSLSLSVTPRPLSWPSKLALGLPVGSRVLPAGFTALTAGSKALPTGSRALLACPETFPASYRALLGGSRALPASTEALSALSVGSRAFPAGSREKARIFKNISISTRPEWPMWKPRLLEKL